MASKMNGLTNGHVENRTTADSDSITTLRSRFEHAKYGDSMKNTLIEDLITRYETLSLKHEAYVAEHDEERKTAKTNREDLQMYQTHASHMQKIMNRDPHVLVLIHGNDVIFNDNFLQSGLEGGKQAANLLHDQVTKWAVATVQDLPAETKIVVRMYANVKLLAESCVFAGIVGSPFAVEEFVKGFTSARTLFTFIDVPITSDKIAEEFKLYLYNYHCRQILLGGSHENGYAHVIQQHTNDVEAIARLTLLEGSPFAPQLAALPFNKTKFPALFREREINFGLDRVDAPRVDSRVDLRPSLLHANSNVFIPRNTASTVQSPQHSVTSLPTIGQGLHNRSDSFASSTADSNGSGGTWAVVTKKSKHLPQTDLTPRPPKEPAEAIKRNRFGQRIDPPIEYDHQEAQALKELKTCNQHFIGAAGCCHYKAGRADKCPHNHNVNLTAKQLKMLRAVARETACKRGHDCADPDCINGHVCPFPQPSLGTMRGAGCINGENCRFPRSMHGMDTVVVKTVRAVGAF